MTHLRSYKTATAQTSRMADLYCSLLTRSLRIRYSVLVDPVNISQPGHPICISEDEGEHEVPSYPEGRLRRG